jgi:hypothetical protein
LFLPAKVAVWLPNRFIGGALRETDMSETEKNAVVAQREEAFRQWTLRTKRVPPIRGEDDQYWLLLTESFEAGYESGRESVIGDIDDTEP